MPAAALADDISNNLDGSVDSIAEVMPLAVGGANGTTTLYVAPRNGDGKNGCNLTGQTLLTVAVLSSNHAVATVAPASITFASCGDTPILTVTPHSDGTATVSIAVTFNNSGGSFNVAPATFTVNVAPPANTPPTLTITGVTAGTAYEFGSVPATTCNVSDAEDGDSSFGATLGTVTGPLAQYGLGAQEASCAYTDAGGLHVAASVTYAIVDTKAPVVSYLVSGFRNLGFEAWYVGAQVDLDWVYSDIGPVAPLAVVGCDGTAVTADAIVTRDCAVTDVAGNSASASVTIQHDNTAPTITATRSIAPNANGWNNEAVTVSFDCADAFAGVSAIGTDCDPKTFDAETTPVGESAYGVVYDNAGNMASATEGPIKIDLTDPDVSAALDRSPASTGWFNAATGAPTLVFTCFDSLSGIDTCPADHAFGNGAAQSFSASATDKAGNSKSAGVTDVNVDTIAPVLNITGAAATTIDVCAGVPDRPTFDPTDEGSSGLANSSDSWLVPTSASGVGTYVYSASATDGAGNTTAETRTYSVRYGAAFGGYLQPVNADGTSRFKLGSTVPVKFRLTCNGVPISTATARLYVAKGDSAPDPGVDEAISTAAATTGNLFRYDASAGQYIFNLSTKQGYTNPGATSSTAFTAGTWTLKILLDDGAWKSVNVQLVK